jgi:transcriptional regulator with XRE-family HTH domain
MNSKSPAEDALTAERRAAVAKVVWARIADLRLSINRLGKLSGLSVNTIQGVLRATGRPHKATLVALSAVLGLDPQHLSDIANGRTSANATSLLEKQIYRLRADIAGLTEGTRRSSTEIEILTGRIDTLIDQQDSRAHRESGRLAPDDGSAGTRPRGLAVKRAASRAGTIQSRGRRRRR